jgi:ribosome-associated protein
LAEEKKAEQAVTLDLRNTLAPADFFVIFQGDNPIHNRAISLNIHGSLRREGVVPLHIEGEDQGRWIVIDYFDVVVHIMLKDVRRLYALERLWSGEERAPQDAYPQRVRKSPLRTPKRTRVYAYPRRG